MSGTIEVVYPNLEEAKKALVAVHQKTQEVISNQEFRNIDAYWSIGPAKNALHDAFQNLKHCSESFDQVVNKTIAFLINAGQAFTDADGNAVQYIGSTLRYPSGDVASVTSAKEKVQEFKEWAMDRSNWTNNPGGAQGGIDADGVYGEQCADIAKAYYQRLFGSSVLITAWANDMPINSYNPRAWFSGSIPSGLQDVSNGGNVTQVKAGDIVFFGGHVAVATSDSDAHGNFRVIEQNPMSPTESDYNVSRAIGCFRPAL
jgi:hypothetical protein